MPQLPSTFACCFDMQEGMRLLAGLQLFACLFWLCSLVRKPSEGLLYDEGADESLQWALLLLLFLNSCVGFAATRTGYESLAFLQVLTFGAQLLLLYAELNAYHHPIQCADNWDGFHTLGRILIHLMWSADACLLMSILGWIALAVCSIAGVYLWYMCVCFLVLLRNASANKRRVQAAIAKLPLSQHQRAPESDQIEPPSCSICLSDFEVGELIRTLPCGHQFRRPCIDLWIRKQGLGASCPLCKHALIPQEGEDAGVAPLRAHAATSSGQSVHVDEPDSSGGQPGYHPPAVPLRAELDLEESDSRHHPVEL
ncbi:hypothetical protein AB1Y20_000296 [Prymnesium parvum]|uniref:RING-type domain-containing protein n=1 Tax=Prymnesium parvum TaxID=97485 RepID=A0AB34K7G3_PRYPA